MWDHSGPTGLVRDWILQGGCRYIWLWARHPCYCAELWFWNLVFEKTEGNILVYKQNVIVLNPRKAE